METKIRRLEILGAVFAIVVGFALHFAYQWSGDNKVVAIFSAVNESTWEHLKLGFWPLLFWSIFEYFISGKKVKKIFLWQIHRSFCFLFFGATDFLFLYGNSGKKLFAV